MSYRRMLLEWTAVSFLVVTLIFSRQFAVMLEESNRFFAYWGWIDSFALICLVSLLSLFGVCVAVVVTAFKSPWVTKIFQHLFLLALASGLLTFYRFAWRPSGWITIIWLLIMAVVGFSLGYPRSRLVKFAKVACLLFSPMVPILFIQMFTLSTWNIDAKSPIAFEEWDEAKSPIFFFIFDAWSYQKSTSDGEFHPYLENLRSFSSKSFVFLKAHSPGVTTTQSLPMILYQADIPLEEKEIFEPWLRRDKDAARKFTSIFERARAQKYSTALIGSYFPYPQFLSDEVDYIYVGAIKTGGRNFAKKVLNLLVNNLRYLNDPISQQRDKQFIRMIHSRGSFESISKSLEEMLWQLEHSSSSTFVIFHLTIPHRPYVFNPDGSYFGHEGEDYRGAGDEAGYTRQLKFLDNVIGKIVATLQNSGKFDKSMIIFTADHSSKFEIDSRDKRTHVPLIIKLPGQQDARGGPHSLDSLAV